MRHGLTKAALADILQLVRLHLPVDCAPASYKSVHRYYSETNLISSAVEHKICIDCGEIMEKVKDVYILILCLSMSCHLTLKFRPCLQVRQCLCSVMIIVNYNYTGDRKFFSLLQGRFSHTHDGCLRDYVHLDLSGSICCLVDYGALINSLQCSSTSDQFLRDAKL